MARKGLMSAPVVSSLALVVLGFAISAASVFAQGVPNDTIRTTDEVNQSEAVKARFPDLPIVMKAPSLTPGRASFTDQDELMAFTAEIAGGSSQVKRLIAGKSQQGRDIPLLLFTAEGVGTLEAAQKLNRPVLWYIGLQHGNEPAGGEGLLAFAAELAAPARKALLERVSVVVVPRANPDGAAAFTRNTASRADSNRDHLLLLLPENQALHGAMAKLPPDVVFDHHEFSVVNRWLEKFQSIQAVDAMVLHATNPMVPRRLSDLAESLFRPAVEAAFAREQLSMFWYYTTSNRRSDRVVSMGGNNPGIARNAFGLRGAVSFLIETRGVGIRREGWQRRVGTHLVAARAILEAAADQASHLRQTIDAARKETAAAADALVVSARIPPQPRAIPLMNPVTGEAKSLEVPFQDSRIIEITARRDRPRGYLIPADQREALDRLTILGVQHCVVTAYVELDLVTYEIEDWRPPADRESINPDQTLKLRALSKRLPVVAGMHFVPMKQGGAGLIASVLEPDMPGSYLSTGILRMQGLKDPPLLAVPAGAMLPLSPFAGATAELCQQ